MSEATASPAANGVDARANAESASPASPARPRSPHSPRRTQASDAARAESALAIVVPRLVVTPIGWWTLDDRGDAELAWRPAFHRERFTTIADLLTQVIECGQSRLVVLERAVCAEAQVSHFDQQRRGG